MRVGLGSYFCDPKAMYIKISYKKKGHNPAEYFKRHSVIHRNNLKTYPFTVTLWNILGCMYVRSHTCGNTIGVSSMLEFFAFLYEVCQLNAFQGDCVHSFAFCLKNLKGLPKDGCVVFHWKLRRPVLTCIWHMLYVKVRYNFFIILGKNSTLYKISVWYEL